MFQRLERLIIVAILMLPAAQGLAFELVVDRGAPLLLDPVTTQQYQAFLAMTRLQLLDQNPGLVFPEQMTSGGQLMSFLDSSVPNFVNRPHNCRFLERIRSTLHNPPAAADLDALTRHGTICVSGDLPADQQDAWVVQMANFLWSKPWIPRNGKNLNLHQLVLEKIGIQEDADVEVLPWRGVDHFDATLSDLSSGDRAFINDHPDLRQLMSRLATFRLGEDVTPVREIATTLADYATGPQAAYFQDVFSSTRAIYIGRQVGPAEAVDALVHEFGHILFDEQRTNFSSDSAGLIYYGKHATHDEACAETLSWITLSDIYSDFPEIKVFHILKLYGFSQVKPHDPHYVGFGAVLPVLESSPERAPQLFLDLTKAGSLQDFLSKHNRPALLPSGRDANVLQFLLP